MHSAPSPTQFHQTAQIHDLHGAVLSTYLGLRMSSLSTGQRYAQIPDRHSSTVHIDPWLSWLRGLDRPTACTDHGLHSSTAVKHSWNNLLLRKKHDILGSFNIWQHFRKLTKSALFRDPLLASTTSTLKC